MADELQIETLIAAMDPRAVMRGDATLRIGQLRTAADMVKRMRKRILRFIAASEFGSAGQKYSHDDYAATLALVTTAQIPAQALFAAVPDRDLATDISAAVGRVKTWAQSAIPRDDDISFLGAVRSEPSALSVADFMALWRVACDPMAAVYSLEDGMLSDEEVALLSMLWPAFYGAVRQAISDAYATVGGRKGKHWEPDPRKAILLRTMLQTDALDYDLAAAVQQASAAQEQQQQTQAPTRRRGSNADSDGSTGELTPGERAAAH